VTGQRKSVKIFGCVDIISAQFNYQRDEVFNAATYLNFLEKVAKRYHSRHIFYIQDNASYHKDKDVWLWFHDHRKNIEVFNLPPYSPELNAVEALWHHTRMKGTHNRYFETKDEIIDTLTRVFISIQKKPDQIRGYLNPFL
jgi:transposase